jgi:hypothetical protein
MTRTDMEHIFARFPSGARSGRPSVGGRFVLLASVLGLLTVESCAADHELSRTEATYVSGGNRGIYIQLSTPGGFQNYKTLPLSPNVKVTLYGQPKPLAALPSGTRVLITRDLETHQVIGIETVQKAVDSDGPVK